MSFTISNHETIVNYIDSSASSNNITLQQKGLFPTSVDVGNPSEIVVSDVFSDVYEMSEKQWSEKFPTSTDVGKF